MTPLDRAIAFASSERFLNLVEKALLQGVILSLQEFRTVIECIRPGSHSVSSTEWSWEEPDSGDFIYNVLVKRVEIYAAIGKE